jgi:hypothetical protein
VHRTGGAFPMHRLVQYEPETEPVPDGDRRALGHADRVTSNLFSGSPEADERARSFDEHPEDNVESSPGQLARARG